MNAPQFPPMPSVISRDPLPAGKFVGPKLEPTHEDVARLKREVDSYRDMMTVLGTLCGDLKDQRDARDEENREMRRHVAALLHVLQGKAKPRTVHKVVVAAQNAMMQPLRSSPLIPLDSATPTGSAEPK